MSYMLTPACIMLKRVLLSLFACACASQACTCTLIVTLHLHAPCTLVMHGCKHGTAADAKSCRIPATWQLAALGATLPPRYMMMCSGPDITLELVAFSAWLPPCWHASFRPSAQYLPTAGQPPSAQPAAAVGLLGLRVHLFRCSLQNDAGLTVSLPATATTSSTPHQRLTAISQWAADDRPAALACRLLGMLRVCLTWQPCSIC